MRKIVLIILIALIPITIGFANAVDFTITRQAGDSSNAVLIENSLGVDQFWINEDGFAFHNGTQIELSIHNINNVTSTGCASGEFLTVTGTTWVCGTAGGGETNTASNIGAGTGLFSAKSGVDLEFDSVIGGTGIDISDTTDDLTWAIDATVLTTSSNIEELNNVTSTGCASGEILKVSGTTWECAVDAGGEVATWTQHHDADEFILKDVTYITNGSSVLTWPQGGTQTLLGNQSSIHDLVNVTSTGCADGQNLQVTSGIFDCVTPSAGGSGFSTVYKTADETINSDTTLTDDADLNFSVDANSNYALKLVAEVDSSAIPDYKHAFSVPTGAIIRGDDSPPFTFTVVTSDLTSSQSLVGGTWPVTTGVNAIVQTGGTSGTVAYQWAQNTLNAANTTLKEGSFIMYKKLN